MSLNTNRIACASALGLLGLLLASGCTGQGKYTREGVSLAEEKMSVLKAGTEWKMAQQAFLAGDLEKAMRKVDASLSLNDSVTKSHVLKGRILIEMGDLGTALESLLTAQTIDPQSADANYYLGIVYERLDETEKAASCYERACELDGFNPAYAVAAAEMMIDLGRLDDAEAYLESGPMFEHDAGVRQALGHIAMIQSKPQRAVAMFEEAALLAPSDPVILEDLTRAEMATGQYNAAEQNLRRLQKDANHAGRRDLQHMRAQCLVELDRPVEARTLYQSLLEGEEGVSDAEAWVGLGNVAFLLDDQRTLRRCASRVVAMAPDRADGYSLWALWYRTEGNLDKAITSIDRAIDARPDDAAMHAFRGVVLVDAGREREAIDSFTDAVAIDPGNAGYRFMLDQAEAGVFATAPSTTE